MDLHWLFYAHIKNYSKNLQANDLTNNNKKGALWALAEAN